jgi:hypothetical protein
MHFGIANSGKLPSGMIVDAFANVSIAFNIFTDVCFATLPVPVLWDLQTSRRMRISLIAVLSLGYM